MYKKERIHYTKSVEFYYHKTYGLKVMEAFDVKREGERLGVMPWESSLIDSHCSFFGSL